MKKQKRILLYGNLCNLGYNYANALNRESKGRIRAELLVSERQMKELNTSNPIWEDKKLINGLPDWINIKNEKKIRGRGPIYSIYAIIYNYCVCMKTFSKYDLIISSTLMNIWAFLCASRYIAMTTGSDITEVAQQNTLLGKIYRKALKRSNYVGLLNTNHVGYAKQLELKNYKFLPFAIDVSKYDMETKQVDKIVILHSSALDWIEQDVRTTNVKRNDLFFKGFANFLKKADKEIIERISVEVLEFGKDIQETKQLVENLGIKNKVLFFPKCTKDELIKKYNEADIIVDQFVVGAFGLNALEAMASKCVVLTYVDVPMVVECYGELPQIINCKTEEDIENGLLNISKNNFYKLEKMKQGNKDWMLKHHDYKNVVPVLIELIDEII